MSYIKWHTDDERLLPERATKNSVGYDFKAPEDVEIKPHESVLIDSKVACDFSSNIWLGIYGRSSFIKKGLINPLGVGVIDSDYFATGNTIKIAIYNNSDEVVTIKKGDAIAQGIFHSVNIGDDIVTTERTGGFGSTDVKDEEYPLIVEINGKKYKAKYCKYTFKGSDEYMYGISVFCNRRYYVFICKDEKLNLHGGVSLFGNLGFLKNYCWYVAEHAVEDCTKEEATNDFIESLIVKEG